MLRASLWSRCCSIRRFAVSNPINYGHLCSTRQIRDAKSLDLLPGFGLPNLAFPVAAGRICPPLELGCVARTKVMWTLSTRDERGE
jgi:hypothetical protein